MLNKTKKNENGNYRKYNSELLAFYIYWRVHTHKISYNSTRRCLKEFFFFIYICFISSLFSKLEIFFLYNKSCVCVRKFSVRSLNSRSSIQILFINRQNTKNLYVHALELFNYKLILNFFSFVSQSYSILFKAVVHFLKIGFYSAQSRSD